jgi:hypothetical protein
MRRSERAAVLLLIATLALPAHAQREPDARATVEGIVSTAETGAPLAFARVSGGVRHATSDDEGRFRLCRVAPGSVAIAAVASLHDTAVVNVTLAPGKTLQVNLALQRVPPGRGSFLIGPHSYGRGAQREAAFFLDGEPVVIDSSACATPHPGVRLVTEVPEDIDFIRILSREEAIAEYGTDPGGRVVWITTRGAQAPKRAAGGAASVAIQTVLDFRANWVGDSTAVDACSVYKVLGSPPDFPSRLQPSVRSLLDRTSGVCAEGGVSAQQPLNYVRVDSIAFDGDSAALVYVEVRKQNEQRYFETYNLGGLDRDLPLGWVREVRTWGVGRLYPVRPGRGQPPE